MKPRLILVLLAAMTCFSMPATALSKCESGGKVIYTDQPCATGKTVKYDTPTANDRLAAERRLTADKRELQRIETERYREEAKVERSHARIVKAAAAGKKKCNALARRKRWADEDAASSAGKAADKARRKARRADEQFQEECGKL